MVTSTGGRTVAHAATVAMLLLTASVLGAGCSEGAAATDLAAVEPEARPSPAPSPSPTPAHAPVAGTRVATSIDIRPVVGRLDGVDRSTLDEASIRAFADQVFDALDAHLTDLQAGGSGILAGLDAHGVLMADPALAEAAGQGLAGPSRPVRAATYDLVAYHDVTVEFAHVTATVTGADDATRTIGLSLAADPLGAPLLVAIEDVTAAGQDGP